MDISLQKEKWADRFKHKHWADQFKHNRKHYRRMSLIPIPKPPKVKVKTKKNKVNALATPPDTFYAGEKLKKAYKDQDTLQRVIAMRVKLPYDSKFLI